MISIEELAKINNLINSCDELVNGRFILSEYKIAKILKDIGESKEIYKLLAECMQNFNFDREFSRAQIALPRKKFVLPEEPEKLLPFVFCLLMEINNKKINLYEFLNEFYSDDENVDPFVKFSESVVKPFRNIIYNVFVTQNNVDENQCDENPKDNSNTVEDENDDDLTIEQMDKFYSDCKTICNEILSEINFEKRKESIEDVKYVVETMVNACNEKNFRNLSALIISFTAMSENLKSIRFLSRELKNILISFFA